MKVVGYLLATFLKLIVLLNSTELGPLEAEKREKYHLDIVSSEKYLKGNMRNSFKGVHPYKNLFALSLKTTQTICYISYLTQGFRPLDT